MNFYQPFVYNRDEILRKFEYKTKETLTDIDIPTDCQLFFKENYRFFLGNEGYFYIKTAQNSKNHRKNRENVIIEAYLLEMLNEYEQGFLLKYHGIFHSSENLEIKAESGIFSLKNALKMGKIYKIDEIAYFLSEICEILAFLEEIGVAYRNLNEKNVILIEKISEKKKFCYRLIDFSNACLLRIGEKLITKDKIEENSKIPEKTDKKTDFFNVFKADVYDLALLCLKMMGFNEKPAFLEEKCEFFNENQHKIREILLEMLHENPGKRPNFIKIKAFIEKKEAKSPNDEYFYYKIWRKKRFFNETSEKSFFLAQQFMKQKQWSEAKFHLKQQENSTNFALLSQIYQKINKFEKSRFFLEKNLVFSEENSRNIAEAYASLAEFSCFMGNYSEAEVFCLKSIENSENSDNLSGFYSILGKIYTKMGKFREAEENYIYSIELLKENQLENTNFFAVSLNNMGNFYLKMRNFEKSIDFFNKSKEIIEKNSLSDDLLIKIMINLGNFYLKIKDFKKSGSFFADSLLKTLEIYQENSSEHAEALSNIAKFHLKSGNLPAADQNYQKSLEILSYFQESLIKIAEIYQKLASIHDKLFKFESARKFYENSVEIYQKLFGRNHEYTATALNNLACFFVSREENLDKVEEIFLKVLSIKSRKSKILFNLARFYERKGKIKESEEYFLQLLELNTSIYGLKHEKTFKVLRNLGILHREKGNLKKSEDFLTKALKIAKWNIKINAFKRAYQTVESLPSINRGDTRLLSQAFAKIEKLGEDASLSQESPGLNQNIRLYQEKTENGGFLREIKENEEGDDWRVTAKIEIIGDLVELYQKMGHFSKALEVYTTEIDNLTEFHGGNMREIAILFNNIAFLAYKAKNFTVSESFFMKSIDIFLDLYGENDSNTGISIQNLGTFYQNIGEYDKSLEFYNRALNIFDMVYGDYHEKIANICSDIADLHLKRGQLKEAEEILERGVKVFRICYGEENPEFFQEKIDLLNEIKQEINKTAFDLIKGSFLSKK